VDRLEAILFDWDENGVRENSASQPPPPPTMTKNKKPKKKKKSAAEKAAKVEAAQDIELAAIKVVLAAAEPYEDERMPAALAHLASEGEGPGDPCEILAGFHADDDVEAEPVAPPVAAVTEVETGEEEEEETKMSLKRPPTLLTSPSCTISFLAGRCPESCPGPR